MALGGDSDDWPDPTIVAFPFCFGGEQRFHSPQRINAVLTKFLLRPIIVSKSTGQPERNANPQCDTPTWIPKPIKIRAVKSGGGG